MSDSVTDIWWVLIGLFFVLAFGGIVVAYALWTLAFKVRSMRDELDRLQRESNAVG